MAVLDPLGLVARVGIWKILAIIFALLNLKNLPFVWHVRVLTGFVGHVFFKPHPLPTRSTPSTLFQPVITNARNSLMDCDWNIHKSNSTYFADFDIARSHLVALLCGRGLGKAGRELTGNKGKIGIMLGGVHCSFRREIKPLQGFEVWTRVLAWDRKWIYIISHFVEKGAVQPKGFSLQPWRKLRAGKPKKEAATTEENGKATNGNVPPSAATQPKIFTSGIAKYVFKKGRLTIPPTRVLEGSGFIPPRPANLNTPSESSTPSGLPESTPNEPALAAVMQGLSSATADEIVDASLKPNGGQNDYWDWQRIEDERSRGMKIAEMFNGLDALAGEFRGEDEMALAVFTDPFG